MHSVREFWKNTEPLFYFGLENINRNVFVSRGRGWTDAEEEDVGEDRG